MAEAVDVMHRVDLANSAWRPNEIVKSSVQPCSCAWVWSAATSRDRPAFVSVREYGDVALYHSERHSWIQLAAKGRRISLYLLWHTLQICLFAPVPVNDLVFFLYLP